MFCAGLGVFYVNNKYVKYIKCNLNLFHWHERLFLGF